MNQVVLKEFVGSVLIGVFGGAKTRVFFLLYIMLNVFQKGCNLFERKPVSSGVQNPGIVVGAFHTRMQSKGFTGQLSGRQRTGVWQGTVRLTLNIALLLPFSEVSQSCNFCGILHPLDNLCKKKYVFNDIQRSLLPVYNLPEA